MLHIGLLSQIGFVTIAMVTYTEYLPPCHAEPDKFEYFRNWMTDSQPATFELHQYVIGIYRIESVRGAKLRARALLASVDVTDVHLHLSFQ